MLNQLVALVFSYYRNKKEEAQAEHFYEYAALIVLMAITQKLIRWMVEKNLNKVLMVTEILGSVLSLVALLVFSLKNFEFRMSTLNIILVLLYLWTVNVSAHGLLQNIGIYEVLNIFISTNVVLLQGYYILNDIVDFSLIFEFSCINLVVLCTQMAFSGQQHQKNPEVKNLYVIISRQDCFRLMIYFLIFQFINNSIRSYNKDSIKFLAPLFAMIPFYIYSLNKFNERQYEKSYIIFGLCVGIYTATEIYIQ